LLSFKLQLNNPSKLAELQELEHWKARFEAADGASQGYFSRRWVANNILNINEEEFQRMQSEMYYDRKHDTQLEQVGEAAAQEAAGGGMGGALGGDMGGDMGGGMDTPPVEETPAAAPAEDAGPLLAAPGDAGGPADAGAAAAPEAPPGKRDDFGRPMTTTKKSKGKWYTPRTVRGGDRRTGKVQAMKAQTGDQSRGKTRRSYLPGMSDLYKLSEHEQTNFYDEQEKKLFRENVEIKKLISSLEEKDIGNLTNENEAQ
jgi:hypothetical protein